MNFFRPWLKCLIALCGFCLFSPAGLHAQRSPLHVGITAHRGNSGHFPENTLTAIQSAIDLGVDWVEVDVFLTADGQVVVTHDASTRRVADRDHIIVESSYDELRTLDVAAGFRRQRGQDQRAVPAEHMPLLAEVLQLFKGQEQSRLSIQPKMDCVEQVLAVVRKEHLLERVGFNDGNLQLMVKVKRLSPETVVFWDRGDSDLETDLETAHQYGFEALVIRDDQITAERVRRIKDAGIEVGVWTVNEASKLREMLELGVERIYTDEPELLLSLKSIQALEHVRCEGTYAHHLQGICTDQRFIYWSFTTTLVKTDLAGKLIQKIPVANHHGDLCYRDGKLYVAVNLGLFNDPEGRADSWVYVYQGDDLKLLAKHPLADVNYGAGGIAHRGESFFVVGGLPESVAENYIYEYTSQFKLVDRHELPSGHTHLGIQTVAFAQGSWWFGCYGTPAILLKASPEFQLLGRYEYDCSLGISEWTSSTLLSAGGKCQAGQGCEGWLKIVRPADEQGLLPAR